MAAIIFSAGVEVISALFVERLMDVYITLPNHGVTHTSDRF